MTVGVLAAYRRLSVGRKLLQRMLANVANGKGDLGDVTEVTAKEWLAKTEEHRAKFWTVVGKGNLQDVPKSAELTPTQVGYTISTYMFVLCGGCTGIPARANVQRRSARVLRQGRFYPGRAHQGLL